MEHRGRSRAQDGVWCEQSPQESGVHAGHNGHCRVRDRGAFGPLEGSETCNEAIKSQVVLGSPRGGRDCGRSGTE